MEVFPFQDSHIQRSSPSALVGARCLSQVHRSSSLTKRTISKWQKLWDLLANNITNVNSVYFTFTAPQAYVERKDTGLSSVDSTGKRSRKSNSATSIRPFLSRIWGEEAWAVSNDLCLTDCRHNNWKLHNIKSSGYQHMKHMKDSLWGRNISKMKTARWQITALCHQNQPPCQNQPSEQQHKGRSER